MALSTKKNLASQVSGIPKFQLTSSLAKKQPNRVPVLNNGQKKARVSKVSIERFVKIVRLARRKNGVTMGDLEVELGVSTASVKRDIEYLKDRLNCPIEWDSRKRAYTLRDDPATGERFELPGLWFDASELFAMLMMLHLVEGVQPGLLEEHVAPMKERVRSMLAAGGKSAKQVERKVKLIHFAPRRVEPKHFKVLATALLEGKKLQLQYLRRDKSEMTDRIISPLQLVHYRENWVLDAWCHLRNELRSFAPEAIEDVRILPESAIEVSQEEMRTHFQSGYGIFSGKATNRAILKFTHDRAQWIALETWHPDQSDKWLSDGSYILEVPYSNDQELVMDVLRYGPEVEVLAPPELRQRIQERLCAAAKHYGDEPAG
ncbi:MAG: WYL domain-containing protein [Polaromonas sp.]|uniref:helix-turn-helix transcriptional regulator n=1 Tax=Polaromonas sp. TaxID=1869339 RepID=UPI0025CCCCE1|nr:WYL domain-containing protein [Polaromonas sp.]MBI2726193.1 WYL domain-containing protein [Polaromonas sp.]